MKIEYVMLADAAQAVGGKLYVLGGGWSVVRAMTFPTPIQLALAISVSFNSTEAGQRFPLAVVIADENGVPVAPEMNASVETGQAAPDLPKDLIQRVPVAVNVGVMVPHAGRYTIVVRIGPSKVTASFDAVFIGRRVEFPAPGQPPERGN